MRGMPFNDRFPSEPVAVTSVTAWRWNLQGALHNCPSWSVPAITDALRIGHRQSAYVDGST